VGATFRLSGQTRDDQNREYLAFGAGYDLEFSAYEGLPDPNPGTYYCSFGALTTQQQFRPARITAKPHVTGPQTAVVVGPAGDEIYTDKYGRVKVQFPWDRYGKKDENSSCWMRVSHPWAGKNWGMVAIPRIGQEVIVDFLEGDPDEPIITGRVYNAEQMPPYALPANQTRSTAKSRSTKGGTASNYNEIRLEDKIGSEQIFINAERDLDLRVENDAREYVSGDRSLIVNTNQRELVNADKHGHVKGSHLEKIDGDVSLNIGGKRMEKTVGDQSSSVGGDRKEQVGGARALTVGKDQSEQIGGNLSLQVGQSRNERVGQTHALEAGQAIHLKGGMTVVIEAGMQLSLKGPGGFIDIGPAGVSIQGTLVMINSGGAAGSGPGASPQSPASPDAPQAPKDPDKADDGTKGGKL
jgi:type VI secretion system secreted protein VgrG